jgi:hypothetical protein
LTYESHQGGLTSEDYSKYPELAEAFDVLGVSCDRQGVEYTSIIEHKQYPFAAVQFHPERLMSGYYGERMDIPKSPLALDFSLFLSRWFINQASLNSQAFESFESLISQIIQTHPLTVERGGRQIYNFNMVFYYTSTSHPNDAVIYMGKDKTENEELIKYSFPKDVWFHVESLSSAHVYL